MLHPSSFARPSSRLDLTTRRTSALAAAALVCGLALTLSPTARAQSTPLTPPAQPSGTAPTPYEAPSQYSAAPPSYVTPVPYPNAPYAGAPDAARGAYVQNLMFQRQAWLQRPVGLGLPITLFSVGIGAIVVGGIVAGAFNDCDELEYDGSCRGTNGGLVSGVLLEIGGAVLASVGTGLFISRLIRRGRRGRELRRIESELQAFGVTASLQPWVHRSASVVSGGLNAGLRF
jgi:hypothetical protein